MQTILCLDTNHVPLLFLFLVRIFQLSMLNAIWINKYSLILFIFIPIDVYMLRECLCCLLCVSSRCCFTSQNINLHSENIYFVFELWIFWFTLLYCWFIEQANVHRNRYIGNYMLCFAPTNIIIDITYTKRTHSCSMLIFIHWIRGISRKMFVFFCQWNSVCDVMLYVLSFFAFQFFYFDKKEDLLCVIE